jgi:ribonuclease PH
VVDQDILGERTIYIDCDVFQADGGTRTASITGGFVALAEACRWLISERFIKKMPLLEMVAAISVGTINNEEILDLCYEEDHRAAVDMNVVMTDKGRFVEVQGTAEGMPFDRARLNRMLDLAEAGIRQLTQMQRETLTGIL